MSKNNITGDNLISKPTTEDYSKGWDLLWGENIISDATIAGKEVIIRAENGCNGKCHTTTTGCKGEGC